MAYPNLVVRICLLFLLLTPRAGADDEDALWLLVDTASRTLSVIQGRQVLQSYDNISIGRGGTTGQKLQGDGKTPLGEYHVTRVSYDSPFYLFIGLDYPSISQAKDAFQTGIIDQKQFSAIMYAHRQKQEPPQRTPLGGYIGIHGIGEGDPQIHETLNWTSGCIALTDRQMEDLETWVYIGMRVVIR